MSKTDDSKLFAFLGVLLTVVGFIIVYAAKKDDKYAMFYAKQGLILFFGWIICWIVAMILVWIPIIGWIISNILYVILLILWVFGLVYSLSGKQKDIPAIGTYAKLLKL